MLLGGARLPGVGAHGDGRAEAVEDGVLQVERHVEVLDDQLVPHRRDRGDGGGDSDHHVGLHREHAAAFATVVLDDGDRAALDDHAHPLQLVQVLPGESQQQRAEVWRDRLAQRHGSWVGHLQHVE